MPRFKLRVLLGLCVALSIAACDRTALEEDDPTGGGGGMTEVATCTASVDGESFEARSPSATTNDQGSAFSLACEEFGDGFLFELRPDGFGETVLSLGVGGNQVQYSVGTRTTNTATLLGGQNAGSVSFQAFTRDRAVGTFFVNVPGFDDGDPIIRVTAGRFDVPVRLDVGDGN